MALFFLSGDVKGSNNSNASSSLPFSALIMPKFMPLLFRIGSIVVFLIGIAACLLYMKQDNLLYFPEIGAIPRHNKDNPKGYRTPAYHNWPFEEHQIKCSDGVHIHSWLLLGEIPKGSSHANNKRLPTIIFFHGNAGNIGLRIPNAIQILMQLERKFNVLMVEYRGYGDSDNVPPNEYGLKLDAEAAIHFCMNHNKIDSNNVFVYGQSLGGAVAFHLAQYCQDKTNVRVAGIMLENTFLSISKMVDQLMPKLVVLLKPLVLRLNWNSEKIATTLRNVPILYLAGEKDELVPHKHMLQLYALSTTANANNPNTIIHLLIVPDGTHNDTWMVGGQTYWNAMRSFLYTIVSRNQQIQQLATVTPSSQPVSIHISAASTVVVPTMSTSILGIAQDAFVGPGKKALDNKQKDL